MSFRYNTTEERLRLPQYGRLVQDMVDHALTLTDKAQRQTFAEMTIRVMEQLNPQLRSTPNHKQILWNHLADIANHQLDIDYPCEIDEQKSLQPQKLSYPGNRIRYRHYGHLIESTLEAVKNLPADASQQTRNELISSVAFRMKSYLTEWRGTGIDDSKVGHDIEAYTDGKVGANEVAALLASATKGKGRGGNYHRNSRSNK